MIRVMVPSVQSFEETLDMRGYCKVKRYLDYVISPNRRLPL